MGALGYAAGRGKSRQTFGAAPPTAIEGSRAKKPTLDQQTLSMQAVICYTYPLLVIVL